MSWENSIRVQLGYLPHPGLPRLELMLWEVKNNQCTRVYGQENTGHHSLRFFDLRKYLESVKKQSWPPNPDERQALIAALEAQIQQHTPEEMEEKFHLN